jgi:ribonuclease D
MSLLTSPIRLELCLDLQKSLSLIQCKLKSCMILILSILSKHEDAAALLTDTNVNALFLHSAMKDLELVERAGFKVNSCNNIGQ